MASDEEPTEAVANVMAWLETPSGRDALSRAAMIVTLEVIGDVFTPPFAPSLATVRRALDGPA